MCGLLFVYSRSRGADFWNILQREFLFQAVELGSGFEELGSELLVV